MTPTTEALAAAMETVREGFAKYYHNPGEEKLAAFEGACELLARWLAENAGRLRVEIKCGNCNGVGDIRWPLEDGGSPWMQCPKCSGRGKLIAPAFPAKEGE